MIDITNNKNKRRFGLISLYDVWGFYNKGYGKRYRDRDGWYGNWNGDGKSRTE